MIELESEFKRNGFRYCIEQRKHDVALYKVFPIHPRTLEDEISMFAHWEVIRIKEQGATTITVGDKTFEVLEKEIYPRDNTLGTDGFTFNTHEDADKFYKALVRREGATE